MQQPGCPSYQGALTTAAPFSSPLHMLIIARTTPGPTASLMRPAALCRHALPLVWLRLQQFLGGVDEAWFRLVHVAIEAAAAPAIAALLALQAAAEQVRAWLGGRMQTSRLL